MALLALEVAVRLLSGFDGLYGQDPYAYYNYARDIQAHWSSGATLGAFNWPRLYPFLGALWPSADPGPWMQFLSMLGHAVTLAMCMRLVQAHAPKARLVAPSLFLFVGLAPFALRNGLCILSDSPALGLATAALWMGDRYAREGGGLRLLFAALLTSLAVWMRYPLALVLFFPWLAWVWRMSGRRDWAWGLLALPAFLVGAVPQLFLLPHPASQGLTHAFQNTQVQQWSLANVFLREFRHLEGNQSFLAPNLLANVGVFWHPRFLGLGLVGMWALLRWRRWGLPSWKWEDVASVLLNALFLSGVPFQNARFLLPVLPATGRMLGPAWSAMGERLPQRPLWRGLLFAGILAVQLTLGIYACRVVMAGSAQDRAIAEALRAQPQSGQRLYEFSLEAMLVARDVPLAAANMWYDTLPPPRAGDLLVFDLPAFSVQFEGYAPMRNWHRIADHHTLTPLASWNGGWKLYEIR